MVRPTEYKKGSLSNVPLMLDKAVMQEFAKMLPRDKSISQAVREYMEEVIEEQKKVNGLSVPILTSQVRQTTMNEYTSIHIKALLATPDETLLDCYKQDEDMMADLRHKLSEVSIRYWHPTIKRK